MKLRPLADRIVVKRDERDPDARTAGGIIIPQTATDQEPAWQGEIVAVGPGRIDSNGALREPRVKTGDRVLVGKYQGTTVTVDGGELVVLREDDLLGVVEAG